MERTWRASYPVLVLLAVAMSQGAPPPRILAAEPPSSPGETVVMVDVEGPRDQSDGPSDPPAASAVPGPAGLVRSSLPGWQGLAAPAAAGGGSVTTLAPPE